VDGPAATGRPKVLASDLFVSPMPAPKPSEVRMGGDYPLGPGDQLALTTFGSLTLSKVLTVDRGGKVSVPEVGIATVAGLTLDGARTALRALLARRHAGIEEFSLEVVGLHDVQVFVIGDVPRPGSYLVPGVTSAVSLLSLAGGPGPEGTYRTIQHLRGGKVLRTLDLYALRFQGEGMRGPTFQDGDCLFVPLAGRRITLAGAFRRSPEPAGTLVELKDGEGAADAVRFAGGLQATASRILLTVQRTSPDGITGVTDISNDPRGLAEARLFDADTLRALPRRERAHQFVETAGAVAVPGRFAFREGMKVHDLLTLRTPGDQVLPRTYRRRGEILRTSPDGATRLLAFDVDGALRRDPRHDLMLEARDRVSLSDVAELRRPETVTVLGPLARPGTYPWHTGMRASDLLFLAGVPDLRASRREAELARFPAGGTGAVLRLDLARLLPTEKGAPVNLDDEAVNPVLAPFDRVTVYEDPAFQLQPTVRISGQVGRPGSYVLGPDSRTLGQLLRRAGGFTSEAMPAGTVFLRSVPAPVEGVPAGASEAAVNDVLQRLNETRRDRSSGKPEPSPLLHGLLAGTTRRLVVDVPAAISADPRRDVALQDGDEIHVPRRTDSVFVAGEVASPYATFHVQAGDRVKDVVKLAGGYTRNADTSQVRLLKASGRIVDEGVARAVMEPGDTLLVPQRLRKDILWQDSLLAMTPLAVLWNAISR